MGSKRRGFWRVWQTIQWCALGAVAVLLLTWVAFQLHFSFLTASFCYLIVLVVQSLAGDFPSSAVVSFVAVACLDYFFVDPRFSFQCRIPVQAAWQVCSNCSSITAEKRIFITLPSSFFLKSMISF